ncbi:MAG TPA: hypothetical protein VH593_07860 [Ktedonobacteraceae bacterium]|jgi:hypothetical protein
MKEIEIPDEPIECCYCDKSYLPESILEIFLDDETQKVHFICNTCRTTVPHDVLDAWWKMHKNKIDE